MARAATPTRQMIEVIALGNGWSCHVISLGTQKLDVSRAICER